MVTHTTVNGILWIKKMATVFHISCGNCNTSVATIRSDVSSRIHGRAGDYLAFLCAVEFSPLSVHIDNLPTADLRVGVIEIII